MTNNTSVHEELETLSAGVLDRHRAISSLMEELEAVDWYDQRAEACEDDELRKILVHNRDEEKEHAAMVLEWLRRNDAGFERHLETYLFTDRSIVAPEADETQPDASSEAGKPSLCVGSLKREVA